MVRDNRRGVVHSWSEVSSSRSQDFDLIASDARASLFAGMVDVSGARQYHHKSYADARMVVWQAGAWMTTPVGERVVRDPNNASAALVVRGNSISAAVVTEQDDGHHLKVLQWDLQGTTLRTTLGDLALLSERGYVRVLALRGHKVPEVVGPQDEDWIRSELPE